MPHWGTCYGPKFPAGSSGYAPDDPHFEMHGLIDPLTGKHWVMPISPCPTERHAHAFDGQTNRHVAGMWNVSAAGKLPKHMRELGKNGSNRGLLAAFEEEREDIGWRNRSCALLDLDHMLRVVVDGLEGLGVMDNTYLIFTSDNGYHLGEHKAAFGKGLPYETDVRLPMYIRGPNVFRNATLPHPTGHLDITATVVDIAGATAFVPSQTPLDGKSFLGEIRASVDDPLPPLLPALLPRDSPPSAKALAHNADAWRQYSFSEFFGTDLTWRLVRVQNSTASFTYTSWCTNDTEIFHLANDPHQMSNLAGTGDAWANQVAGQFAPAAAALGACHGSACSAVSPAAKVAPFRCYNPITSKTARIGGFKAVSKGGGGALSQLHGWVVDRQRKGGPGSSGSGVRGWPASMVRVKLDMQYHSALCPDTLANTTRPDLAGHPGVPNLQHGFNFDVTQIVARTVGDGKIHTLTLWVLGDASVDEPEFQPLLSNGLNAVCVRGGNVCKCP